MADDIRDLGSAGLWRPRGNWGTLPDYDFDTARQEVAYKGTVTAVEEFTPERPHKLEFEIQLRDHSEQFDFLEQFHAVLGMHNRAWLVLPLTMFRLVTQATATDTVIEVARCEFDYRGFERIAILLKDGDLITRAITASNFDENSGTLFLSFADGLDRVIAPDDVLSIATMPLIRLGLDAVTLEHDTDGVASVSVKVVELVNEYSDI